MALILPESIATMSGVLTVANGPFGKTSLAVAVGTGTFNYFTSSATVTSIDTGTLGAGAGTGTLLVPIPDFVALMQANFLSVGMSGAINAQTANDIAIGISFIIMKGQVVSVHPSVGNGVGVGSVVPKFAAPVFIAAFLGAGLSGDEAKNMAIAIGNSVDIICPKTIAAIVIAGPTSILPSFGSGTGKII